MLIFSCVYVPGEASIIKFKMPIMVIAMMFYSFVVQSQQVPEPASLGTVTFEKANSSKELRRIEGTNVNVSVLTESQAQEAFSYLLSDKKTPFMVPDDGCYAKSQKIALNLEKLGYISAKVFMFGKLRIHSKFLPSGSEDWNYHVSPVIYIKRGGQIQLMVIDPSMASRVVSIDELAKKLTQRQDGQIDAIMYTNRFVYSKDNIDETLVDYKTEDLDNMEETLGRLRRMQVRRDVHGVVDYFSML